MNREQIRGVLQTIFQEETGETLAALPDESVLAKDFALDSVDMVGLLMRVEGHFHVRLTNAELAESQTVGALIDLVRAKLEFPQGGNVQIRAAA
ncbi:MAG TPA: acyl carrier protein [Pirellulales bacterium]|nr:acyl carrier protein [Pirellulales bacterium]